MKKKYIATLVAIMLLAGCGTPAPAAPSTTDEPDMEAIIQRSVDEAVKEKLEQIEEEQKKKDEEIAKLKEQLEDLTAQSEAPPRRKTHLPQPRTPRPRPLHPANQRLLRRRLSRRYPRNRSRNQHQPPPSSQRKPSR